MKKTIQRANERGEAKHDWLHARFSFSFANYYNPKRTGFGALKVLNDDTIEPGTGFGAHPHANMEIITIPTRGTVAHADNTGSEGTITTGQIQVMSAGKGIIHSEFNDSQTEQLQLFQIWIEPNKRNAIPRYETKNLILKKNVLNKIVSGNKKEGTLFINQDANILLGEFDTEKTLTYKTKENKGIFILTITGKLTVEEETLKKRDSIEITNKKNIQIKTTKNTQALLIEVPM